MERLASEVNATHVSPRWISRRLFWQGIDPIVAPRCLLAQARLAATMPA